MSPFSSRSRLSALPDDAPQPRHAPTAGIARLSGSTLQDQIKDYLTELMRVFAADVPSPAVPSDADSLPEAIFTLLTGRQFSHLQRARTRTYREQTVRSLAEGLRRGGPLEFSYDIGPGYHASIRPGELDLTFSVGFSELLILSQVASFCARLKCHYAPGARFWLVVDNLCGLRTNDIEVNRTLAYCKQLRDLIQELGLGASVGLIVESEAFDIATYDRILAEVEAGPPAMSPSEADVQNVARFIGRRCTSEEAEERIERYRRALVATERLLERVVRGVRMSQRASATTLGFRPFPGGDSRTQCGEVALAHNAHGKLHPILLTSRNVDAYHCTHFACNDQLPLAIPHVVYARPVGD